MTTIVANGYYMIGDRRTTDRNPPTRDILLKSEYLGFSSARRVGTKYHDKSPKVIPLPKTTYKHKKIACIAGSGSLENILEYLSFLNYMTLDDLIRVRGNSRQKISLTQLLLITEDSRTHRVSFSQHDHLVVVENTFEPGKMVAIGSGGNFLSTMEERVPGLLENLHPLSAFLFATNTDKGSSNCYDVYGVKEGQYFSKILPTPEEVEARCNEVASRLTFGRRGKVHNF